MSEIEKGHSASRYASENQKNGKKRQEEQVRGGSRYTEEEGKKRKKKQSQNSSGESGTARSGSRYTADGRNLSEENERIGSRYALQNHTKGGQNGKQKAGNGQNGKQKGNVQNGKQRTGDARDEKQSIKNPRSAGQKARARNWQEAGNDKVENRMLVAASLHQAGDKLKERIVRKDPLKLAVGLLAGVVLIAYVIVAVYFGSHFYSGITVYGIDCTHQTVAQVREEIDHKIGDYRLTVAERDGLRDEITADQIELQYQDDHAIEQMMKSQRSYLWPVMMLLKRSEGPEVHTVYNKQRIDAVMDQMNAFLPENVVPPRDAYRGDTEDAYEVVPEVMGTTLDRTKTKEVLMAALEQGAASVSLDGNGCYIDPEIYRDNEELNAEVEKLNSLLTAHITYDFADRQEVVDGPVIKQWIVRGGNGDYYIDDNRIWAYVEQLADKYDTFGGSRTFQTSIGTTVNLFGGDYGWCIDQNATAQILSEDVKAGKVETIQPQYAYTAQSRAENDIGDTYVEVSISMQEMWCYKDGELIVDTPVVTGNPNRNNATPAGGVWAIDAKMTDYTLRGEGYATPVSYWMPFNGNVGIHDLQSRYYFGGTIYLTNGSHGCVNTPYDAVRTIFHTVSIGTPVVVY